jgi:DNA-directed RNA polymerase specialized sigma24 family protein
MGDYIDSDHVRSQDYKDILSSVSQHIRNKRYYDSLTKKHRAAIVLKATEAFTLSEIAIMLRLNKSTIWRIWLRLKDH